MSCRYEKIAIAMLFNSPPKNLNKSYCVPISMWKSFQALKSHHQVIFAVLIGAALILFWRGIWGLADLVAPIILFNNPWLYFSAMVVIGFLILAGSGLLMRELAGQTAD